jgi:aminopeptidase
MDTSTLTRYAELITGVAANVQPGQVVAVSCEPGKEYLARAVAASAYRRGAKYVDVGWFDPWVKRARLDFAPEETLDYVPPWVGERILALGEHRAARVALSGPSAPGLFDDVDLQRAARDRLPAVPQVSTVTLQRTTNWTVVPCPTPGWAALVHPDVPRHEGLARLEAQVAHVCRLDEDDPKRAWEQRLEELARTAAALTELRLDAVRFEGPGTSLTVGLFPSSRWIAARAATVEGIEHVPNLPTEEVFTTPDPARVEGTVSATRPVVLPDGTLVKGLSLRFEHGRAVSVDADSGGHVIRSLIERDEGARGLGEVARVDARSRVGALDTLFYDTLLDENATSHLALGVGIPIAVDDERERAAVNRARVHLDFMVGSPQVEVTGLAGDGSELPLVRDGRLVELGPRGQYSAPGPRV